MILAFGDYELDTELFELRCAGKQISIEPQVFDLLVYLAQHNDRIVSRDELLNELWSGKIVTESTINSCIKTARHAVGDDGRTQHCIATFNRRGYRFITPVVQRGSSVTLNKSKLPELAVSSPLTLVTQNAPDRPTLAVLPFSHNHGTDEVSWIAEVFSEDVSIRLARIPGFLVVSRNSSSYFRGREVSIGKIGRELRCQYLVQGSIWMINKIIRVSVQLFDTSTDQIMWSDRREVQFDRLGELQEEMVREIVGLIEPELNRAEFASLQKRRSVDLKAWELYRKGHALLSLKGWSEASFKETAGLLRQAIAYDPELAFAHAYLALVLAIGHLLGLTFQNSWREDAIKAAERAIELDSQDTDVLGYAGCAFADMGDHLRGIDLLRRAIALDPSNAQAVAALGAALLQIGDEDGIEYMRQGLRISPYDNRSGVWGALLARGLLTFDHIEEAIEAASVACRCDDKVYFPRVVLAVAHTTAGSPDKAKIALDDARRIRPELNIDDIARFASNREIIQMKKAGLVKTPT